MAPTLLALWRELTPRGRVRHQRMLVSTWQLGCQIGNWTITLVTPPTPFNTHIPISLSLVLSLPSLICCSSFQRIQRREKVTLSDANLQRSNT